MGKEGGMVIVMDFSFVDCKLEDNCGSVARALDGNPPGDFEMFEFLGDNDMDTVYKVFNIPASLMMKAGLAAGFRNMTYKRAYADDDFKNHEMVKKYLIDINGPDYIL